MNKLAKLVTVIAVVFSANIAFSQDYPTSLHEISNKGPFKLETWTWRIYGGPEMAYVLEADNSVMKGGKLGLNCGVDLNKRFTKMTYGIVGANIVSGGSERWINDAAATKSSFDKYATVEIPIGVGFDFGTNPPLGLYTNLTFINSFTAMSKSEFTTIPFSSFEVSSNVKDNTLDFYNFGFKVEAGFKVKVEKENYSCLALSFKPMFLNRLSTNTTQYTTLNAAAIFGYYF